MFDDAKPDCIITFLPQRLFCSTLYILHVLKSLFTYCLNIFLMRTKKFTLLQGQNY
ncbi:hypothetical protein ASZ90_017462 [hydrocarbon metagenome]|uniref:Uncharacterized protein n=1 Tax=hydrocarbon metagenome TaxID=938273 RepID=A0A0W8E946_9ZZZZ